MSAVDPGDWGRYALCRTEGHPSDWDDELDGPETERQRQERHARAKEVCARCPVRDDCALHTDLEIDTGIRFGLHLEEWRRERRRQVAIRMGRFGSPEGLSA